MEEDGKKGKSVRAGDRRRDKKRKRKETEEREGGKVFC